MKRHCDFCGIEADEHWVESYNTRRRTGWRCWECYKNSQYEANKSDLTRQKKLYQIHNSKKRNK